MTNNQLALDFAREVMGWENPSIAIGGQEAQVSSRSSPIGFYYERTESVLSEVQRWCDEHDCVLNMAFIPGYGYDVDIWPNGAEEKIIAGVNNLDLSTALMTACLAAERKRIGAKGGE